MSEFTDELRERAAARIDALEVALRTFILIDDEEDLVGYVPAACQADFREALETARKLLTTAEATDLE